LCHSSFFTRVSFVSLCLHVLCINATCVCLFFFSALHVPAYLISGEYPLLSLCTYA
jgi:hypothetical protein